MTDRSTSVIHSTFTLERTYPVPVSDTFAAWSKPEAKASWFATPGATHTLDFRVGGSERVVASHEGKEMSFDTLYRDIVEGERIVYTSVLAADGRTATVSLTTIELSADGDGTRLVLTEQGTFLDGQELPEWREQGTGDQLDALGRILAGQPAR